LILFDLLDLFDLQSPQLVEHSFSVTTIRDLNKVIIIIVINVPTRGLLVVETKVLLFCGWQNLISKDLFVNSEYRYYF